MNHGMNYMINKIKRAIKKFELNLENKIVLTEAATGNYVVTAIIAALAGAKKVYAYTKDSKYGSIDDVKKETYSLAKQLNIEHRIEIVTDLSVIDYKSINIMTNTGFLRPINKNIIERLNNKCVIPLMWETWEFREEDLSLESCLFNKIKVYGTNENDKRLRTKEYIGYMALKFLLDYEHTPINANVLVLGCNHFTNSISKVLKSNNYKYKVYNNYEKKINVNDFDALIIAEHENKDLIIGIDGFLNKYEISSHVNVMHICGNVDFEGVEFSHIPSQPAPFGYMSFTTDFIDKTAVIDLHTAGLSVAEGMLKCNELGFEKYEYKKFMENNYPAMAFKNERFW